ncbi:MAG: hypothetical protein MZW92_48870 [Comamonadaceae bacterium]|nr:hypothetical protein [Comamonadaceae bacterium]
MNRGLEALIRAVPGAVPVGLQPLQGAGRRAEPPPEQRPRDRSRLARLLDRR